MNDHITQEMKRHAVFISFPAQGHVSPMMILAKLLHHRGFHITFVNTEFNHQRLPDFRFETIPDGLPLPTDLNATQDIPSLFHSIRNYMLLPFLNLIKKLNNSNNNKSSTSFFSSIDIVPPVTCIVSDGVISFLSKLVKNLESHSLWKEETECLKWIDSKEPNSVVYVNFGSVTVMTTQQLIEFAWGLANSKHDFLWVVRANIVKGDTATLPTEFVEETKDRGLLASWCPQEDVLKHPSIGVFLTHSGWNSTIESISGGVPVICWPFFAEQQTNCRYSYVHWGIGMEIDNNVKRDEVEKLVREVMKGEKGKAMKNRAVEWKKKAEDAISPVVPLSIV
ncbi:hypothetical protein MKX01_034456 [Papaver californicum]|nr:hypothetical protein MKX01_034456 [Papaver californicum]